MKEVAYIIILNNTDIKGFFFFLIFEIITFFKNLKYLLDKLKIAKIKTQATLFNTLIDFGTFFSDIIALKSLSCLKSSLIEFTDEYIINFFYFLFKKITR